HLIDRVNQALRQARYDSSVSSNLARHFRAVGLVDVQSRAHLGHIRTLREHPFWRDSLRGQIQGAVSAGLLTAAEGQALSADIEELDRRGEFNLWHILHTAVGTKGG
ncbi:MAG: Demethylmenaquinone methyltransferase, partial [Dehalococcoidia bacterium]|nr:Demethylmenaquinone methyltransferase [Dehalococcoidia bacterium]